MKLRLIATTAAAIVLTGCGLGQTSRQPPMTVFPDMRWQDRYDPQEHSSWFGDGRASRRPVEGTVARGAYHEEQAHFDGVVNGQYIGKNPLTIDEQLMATGQRRFNTYCAPCHDQTGQGRGLVGQRATWIPTNLHDPRVRQFNDGEIFNVITNGRRSMPAYRFQVTESDRWAIVAYVRALQRAVSNTLEDMPADQRASLQAEAQRRAAEEAKAEAEAKAAAEKAAAEAAAESGTPAPAQPGQTPAAPGTTPPAGQVK